MKSSDCFNAALRHCVIALGLCAVASPAAAEWSGVAAVPATPVITVRTNGDTIVAGMLTLAYVSTDAGANWQPTSQIGGGVPIQTVLVRNGTLYAGTNGLGVYTSGDLGLTWHAFNDGLVGGLFNSQFDVSDLEVLGDNLYAGTFGAGVYVRDLAGAGTWHHFGEEFEPNQASNIRALAVGGTRLLADGGGNGSVFVRDPGDADWTISWLDNVGLRPGLEAFSTVWTGTRWVVATGVGRGVFTSAQGQEPWTFVNLGLGLLNSGTVTTRGHHVFGAFNRNADVVIEQSGDDGVTWEVLDVLPNAFVFQMATHDTDLYAGRADGLGSARPRRCPCRKVARALGSDSHSSVARGSPSWSVLVEQGQAGLALKQTEARPDLPLLVEQVHAGLAIDRGEEHPNLSRLINDPEVTGCDLVQYCGTRGLPHNAHRAYEDQRHNRAPPQLLVFSLQGLHPFL